MICIHIYIYIYICIHTHTHSPLSGRGFLAQPLLPKPYKAHRAGHLSATQLHDPLSSHDLGKKKTPAAGGTAHVACSQRPSKPQSVCVAFAADVPVVQSNAQTWRLLFEILGSLSRVGFESRSWRSGSERRSDHVCVLWP